MSTPMMKSAAFMVGVAVLVGSAAGLSFVVRTLGAHLTKLPIQPAGKDAKQHTIPSEVRGWPGDDTGWRQVGIDNKMSPEEIEELGTADTISRLYAEFGPGVASSTVEGRRPRAVQLHTAYYTGMIDTVPHVPDRCITAAGTAMDGSPREVPVPLDMSLLTPDPAVDQSEGPVYRIRNTRIGRFVRLPRGIENLRMTVTPFKDGRTGERFYAGYFFIANGGVVASANGVRLLAFRLQDDYAYYLKVQFTSADAKSEEGLGELAGEVLNNMLPEIALRVPDWIEVQAGRYPPRDERPTK